MTKASTKFSINNRSNIVKASSKFVSYSDFIKNGKDIYSAAQYYDCVDDIKNMFNNKIKKQMEKGKVKSNVKWTNSWQVMKDVRACKSATEFGQSSLYLAAKRFGILDDAKQVFKDRKHPSKTKEEVMAEAAKYTNRQDMLAHSTTAYRIAINNGWELNFGNTKSNEVVEETNNVKPATTTVSVELNTDDLFKILVNDKFTNEQKNIALKLLANV